MQFISADEFGGAEIEARGLQPGGAGAPRELGYANSTEWLKDILTFNPGFASESVSFA
jgi:hypothetical protein